MPAADKNRFTLDGPDHAIEVLLETPVNFDGGKVAVLCHPHPLYQGSMDNKVVHTLARALHDLGVLTLRFNFRGVGKSEGEHDEGVAETADCVWLARWLQEQHPEASLWLGGFSFGGMIATLAASQLSAERLVTIAPAVGFVASGEDPVPATEWLLVQGAEDEIIDPQAVQDWVATLAHPPKLIMLPGTGHFFHGQLVTLKQTLLSELQ